ncbi:aKG-HExxH-type peptide beta-hydroxylase [Streptomyces umbrinus]|uniref:aKG-HExxH-type peptide beta-hydroxylase n=1 Tax=Streptomyces umbrinus TaxID=67370 RepID=UPI001675826B|nr:HEXXH motif-containing putative peptide modification protein [Streptomyces umbrinus]
MAPGAQVTYNNIEQPPLWALSPGQVGMLPWPSQTAPPLSAVSMPLAVPQRRVAPDRLRGREELVAGLTDAVTRRAGGDSEVQGVWLLSGMGGCGKTTVALETAHRLTGSLAQVWWVSGADGEGLSGVLRAVAFAAGARAADFDGLHPADVLWKQLDALTTPWLLVLDNVDDPAVLAAVPARTAEGIGWLRKPARAWGTVLITSRESRAERWGHWVHMVDVGLLSREDGAKMLSDLAPRAGAAAQARELAERLGGLPLALDLAGSYLARALDDPLPSPSTPVTFAAYSRSLDVRLADMASDPDTDLGPAERSRRAIMSTWELSLDLLHRQGTDLARPLLRLLSAFGPAPIPYQELLDADLLAESEFFSDPTRPQLREALKGLAGLKLITIEMTCDAADASAGDPLRWITIHPMVRAASRAHADFAAQAPPMLRLVTALLHRVTSPLEAGNPAHWPVWRAIAPHGAAARLLLSACEHGVDDGTDADLVAAATEPAVGTAEYHIYVGLYGEAIAELEPTCEVRARLLGDEHPATIAARLQLARALRDNGDLAESDQLFRYLADVGERSLPDAHPYLQSARTGRARTLRQLGQYEAAEAELRAALTLRLRDPQANPQGILRIRHDLARLAHKRGRLEEAVSELRDVRRLILALAGESDLDALATGVSLARALREAGHAEEAEGVAEDVVREHLNVLSPNHPQVLIARQERARIIRDHESDPAFLERARDEFTDVWRINERQFGPDHPDTIATRHELATVWHLLGRPDLAAEHFRAALEAGRRRLGEHHPNVAICARNLALVFDELAQRAASPPSTGNTRDNPDDAEPWQGATPMGNPWQVQSQPPSAAPDLTGLSLEEALSPERHRDGFSPATARLLARFIRPRRTSTGSDPGDGDYSSAAGVPETRYSPPNPGTPSSRSYRPSSVPRFEVTGLRRRSELVFPSPDAIRALATGKEDPTLIERLRAHHRGIRALALGELLHQADAVPASRADVPPMVSQVRDLLLRAELADPEAVTTVLLHPTVGRWMSRALRAFESLPDGPSAPYGPPSADLPHLHAVAAAAAVRAGLTFTLPVPLRGGFAFLPTLGAADLRAAGATTAHVVATNGSTVVRSANTEVRLPSPAKRTRHGWIPAYRVHKPVGPGHFNLLLDDLDPYRETDGPVAGSRLDPREVNRWQQLTRDAGNLLARADPRQAEAMAAALTTLTPRPATPGGVMNSVSSTDAFGGIVLSTPTDHVELAVTLVHEFRHMKLNAVLDVMDLYGDEGQEPETESYYAPWRDDPRPLSGFFHGVFAFFGVVDFWRRLTHEATGDALRRAQFQLVHWRMQTWDAYTALRSSPRLTQAGREFAAMMGDSAKTWTDHPLPPDDVTTLATEAVLAHRSRWRLHHLHPQSAAVAELAEAWSSGAPHPPEQHVASALRPDSAVPSLHNYTALLCRAATDQSHLPRSSTAPGVPGPYQEVVDPADVARLQGEVDSARRLSADQVTRWPQRHEPWIRLGLALRRPSAVESLGSPSTAVAAQSLTHRPEVVRAVHARVAAVTGTPPEPVALAGWIGVPDGSADLPGMPTTDVP